MKEHTRRKVNVLGIDVSLMRPEKAVNITMNYVNRKEINQIYFHSAASSLFCQDNEWAADWIETCDLVFAGDKAMEQHILAKAALDIVAGSGNGTFADSYIKRLLNRLNREKREIFAVMPSEEHLETLKDYIHSTYDEIHVDGAVLSADTEAECEKVINEINGVIPDIVFVCVTSQAQLYLMKNYHAMMNTHVIIGVESLLPLIQTETENIPEWIEMLHLTGLYKWIRKKGKIQEKITSSMFEHSIQQEYEEEKSSDEMAEDEDPQ